jgi:hypothetical protein
MAASRSRRTCGAWLPETEQIMRVMWKLLLSVLAMLSAGAAAHIQTAQTLTNQTWPTRTITIVVPYPAGGSIDLVGREVGNKISAALGQSIVIENVNGASGNIGSAQVARAAPDGHTLLLTTNAPLVFNRFLLKQTSFDPIKDFEPIIFATVTPIALASPSSSITPNAIPARSASPAPAPARPITSMARCSNRSLGSRFAIFHIAARHRPSPIFPEVTCMRGSSRSD